MNRVIRILIVGMTDNPGGMEAYIMNLYRHIDGERFQFDFIVNYYGEVAYKDEIEKLGGNIIPLFGRNENAFKHYIEYSKFFKTNSNKYDVVYLNTISLVNLDSLIFAKRYGITVRILHSHNNHDLDTGIRKIISRYHQKRLKKYANLFLACSKEAGQWMFPEEKFTVIKNAIDIEEYKFNKYIRQQVREKNNWQEKLVIGNVGRLALQKNPIFSIEVFYEIYKKNPNSICIHIGDGDIDIRKQMEEKIETLNLQDKYILLGIRKDISELYQAMDAFLFPSLFEGLPFAMVEAQAAGLPCFTSVNVPKEADITEEQVEFISLEKRPKEWAEIILGKLNQYKRKDSSSAIIEAGYDSNNNNYVVEKEILRYLEREKM